jgi:hypothetical protein
MSLHLKKINSQSTTIILALHTLYSGKENTRNAKYQSNPFNY